MRKRIAVVLVVILMASLVGCGQGGDIQPESSEMSEMPVAESESPPEENAINGIVWDLEYPGEAYILTVGDSLQRTASVTPMNAQDTGVVFASSHPEVATVDRDGVVTANGVGKATITAFAKGNMDISIFYEITVEDRGETDFPESSDEAAGASAVAGVVEASLQVAGDRSD